MTTNGSDALLVDWHQTRCLCDVGQPDYLAVVAVDASGAAHLVLAEKSAINDDTTRVDTSCSAVAHEQPGKLPLEHVRRITAACRAHRCGRTTSHGRPCRLRVTRPGAACEFHRDVPPTPAASTERPTYDR